MVHRSMRNDSRMADELYIKRVLLVLEDFLFFSLYSFSCIAKQVTTLNQIRYQSCPDFLETNLELLVLFSNITILLPISPMSSPARYNELQSTLEASSFKWPALRNHIPCMAHVVQLALGAFMSSLGVQGCTKSWEAHERDLQFAENESIDIEKSQRLRKEGNARIKMVSAMKPGLAKIIEKVCIS